MKRNTRNSYEPIQMFIGADIEAELHKALVEEFTREIDKEILFELGCFETYFTELL